MAARRAFYTSVLERLQSLPGISSVALTDRLPFGGETYGSAAMRIVVRSGGDATGVVEQVRTVVRSLDGDTPVDQARSMGELIGGSVDGPRFAARLIGAFARWLDCCSARSASMERYGPRDAAAA